MAAAVKPPGWDSDDSPFHAGERAVQERIGVRERIEQTGRRIVRRFMPEEHRQFFEDLPFLLIGSEGTSGEVWASLLLGAPGFLHTPSARRLEATATILPGDPLASHLKLGAPLGALGIELSTRRRNRVNGRVVAVGAAATQGLLEQRQFAIEVEQSFGNCKQYIQSRAFDFAPAAERRPPKAETASLSEDAMRLLRRTDTTFIATSSRDAAHGGSEGVDISHRGGRPGFVRVDLSADGALLTMPDFSGNFLFNSFGNLEVNPHAGLLALDFENGDVLSLTGTARVLWDAGASFPGAERLLEFRPHRGLHWTKLLRGGATSEMSPHLRNTGPWSA